MPDPDDEEIQETLDEIKSIDEIGVDINKIKKKAIPIEKSFFIEEFICAVKSDIELLKRIYTDWFESDEIGIDPKYNVVKNEFQHRSKKIQNEKSLFFRHMQTPPNM